MGLFFETTELNVRPLQQAGYLNKSPPHLTGNADALTKGKSLYCLAVISPLSVRVYRFPPIKLNSTVLVFEG